MSAADRHEGFELELELPAPEERERLLDALARLVRQRGFAPLVGHPVLLPEGRFFPDRVEGGPRAVAVLLRRLLAYAGIGDYHVHVTAYDNREHVEYDHHGIGQGAGGAAAWFAGIDGAVCRFGVERRELRDAEELIGTLGHEVAHAYRAHYGLAAHDPRVEEQLTDITAIYLGFGAFLLRSSWSFKTGGYSVSGERLLWEKHARGYLSPARIALLLGAQSVIRSATKKERKAIAASLGPNHARLYEDACALLDAEVDALRGRMAIPDPSEWPEWPELDELTRDLDLDDVAIDDAKPEPTSRAPKAQRKLTHRAAALALTGAGLPFLGASLELISGMSLLIASVVGATIGAAAGRALVSARCEACNTRTRRDAKTCPSCRATLVDEVHESDDAPSRNTSIPPDYDYHTDPELPHEERAEARLLSAMFLAWAIKRDLVSRAFREENPELVARVLAGSPDSHELYAAWIANRHPFNERGAKFADHYLDPDGAWPGDDYGALRTAELTDSPGSYQRFAAVLDARFRELELAEAEQ